MKTYLTPLATLSAAMLLLGCGQSADTSRTGGGASNDNSTAVGSPDPYTSSDTYETQRPALEDELNTPVDGMSRIGDDEPLDEAATTDVTTEEPAQDEKAAQESNDSPDAEQTPAATSASEPMEPRDQQPTPSEQEMVPAEPVTVVPSEEEEQQVEKVVEEEQKEMIQADVDKAKELKTSLQEVQSELKEAQETLANFTRQQKAEDYKREMRDKLDSFDSEIEPVQKDATELKKTAEEQQKVLAKIKQQRQVLLDKLKAMNPANPEEVEKMQKEIDQEWQKLEELSRELEQMESTES